MVGAVQFFRRLSGVPLFMLLLASPAVAEKPGVHVDPDTPAGKEYAIPIDQARREAQGTSQPNTGHGSNGSAPLFGAGISPRSGGGAGSSDRGRGSHGSSKGGTVGARKSGGNPSQGERGASRPRAAIVASTDTGGAAAFQTATLVAAVLLAGGLLGSVLHRVRRKRPD